MVADLAVNIQSNQYYASKDHYELLIVPSYA